MPSNFVMALLSVFIISLISFAGVFTFKVNSRKLRKFLIYMISFSAGALFGDVFLHLLPEITGEVGFETVTSLYLLGGIVIFFLLEKVVYWQHCHGHILEESHVHSFAYMNLVGDTFHNFLDGIIIATAYLINVPAGIATTVAVGLHEIPQEIGDFGVLIHGGFTKTKALFLNFASALASVIGVLLVFTFRNSVENIELFLVPIAAGGFIYIAGSDLIPELHKDSDNIWKSFIQLISFIAGILVMVGLLFLG